MWKRFVSFILTSGACSFTIPTTFRTNHESKLAPLFSDGNPPPFGDWGAASAPAAPMETTSPAMGYAPAAPVPAPTAPSPGVVSGDDPIAALSASQQSSVDAIKVGIPDLAEKPDLSWTGESLAGSAATLSAYDAPGSSNVAWMADVCVPGQLSSLTIFNGPLTDVPHILSRACMVDGSLQLAIDVRPRAYGAYELVDGAGNYPGPEELGRKAFEYSGARNDFFNKFGTDDLAVALDSSQFEGANAIPLTELDMLTGSPLALALSMPPTADNVAKAVALRERVANAWLTWAGETTHEHRPGAPVNTQYVYDSKFRQNAYSALLPLYSATFGAGDGAKLAAAESGPLDEGYVGGGS